MKNQFTPQPSPRPAGMLSPGQHHYPGGRMWLSVTFIVAVLFMLLPGKVRAVSTCYSWTNVGSGFNACSTGYARSLTIANDGTPYVAFTECITGNVSVMKYAGGSWQYVGGAGSVSDGTGDNAAIAIDGAGTPYVAYSDGANSDRLNIKKFDGSSWQVIGTNSTYINYGYTSNINLRFDGNNHPYVVFKDASYANYASAYTLSGTFWQVVGSGGFTNKAVDFLSFGMTSLDSMYVVYRDASVANGTIILQRYRNYGWYNSYTVSPASAKYCNMAIDNRDSVYVVYVDEATGDPKVVKFDGVSGFRTIGSLPSGQCSDTRIVIDNNNQPFVVLSDTSSNSVKAYRFDGSSWNLASTSAISSAKSTQLLLAKNSAGTMYVTFPDNTNSGNPIVKKLDEPISGSPLICIGDTRTYTSSAAGGTWSSDNSSVATINASTGSLTAIGSGTATISYTTGSCNTAITVTVSPNISGNNGSASIDKGATVTFSNSGDNGRWASSDISVARVSGISGAVLGVSNGTTIISYSTLAGCIATTQVTVHAACFSWASVGGEGVTPCAADEPSVAADNAGNTYIAFRDNCTFGKISVMKYNGSSWTYVGDTGSVTPVNQGGGAKIIVDASGTPYVAFYDHNFGGGRLSIKKFDGTNWVYVGSGGITAGASSYFSMAFNSSGTLYVAAYDGGNGGGCEVFKLVGTNWEQVGPAISTTLTDYEELAISPSGVPYVSFRDAASSGKANMYYFNGSAWVHLGAANFSTGQLFELRMVMDHSGTPYVSYVDYNNSDRPYVMKYNGSNWVYLNDLPIANHYCSATSLILDDNDQLIYTAGDYFDRKTKTYRYNGSSWDLLGGQPSLDTVSGISYMAVDGSGAIYVAEADPKRGYSATVKKLLKSAVTGTSVMCAGNATTLADPTPGGTWTSNNTAVATVNSATGVVTGVSGDTTSINYVTNAYCSMSKTVTVNPLPTISGTLNICLAATSSLTGSPAGGTWTAGTGVSVNSSGVVTGNTVGTANLTYTLPTGCRTTTQVTVYAYPASISGSNAICAGKTMTLTDVTTGGTWSSTDGSVAAINSANGVVTAVAAGSAVITYATNAYCTVTKAITVNALPATITGSTHVCLGLTTSLSNTTAGGSWTSSNTGIATANAAGVITGAGAGSATITYQLTATGCLTTAAMSVNAFPAAIGGVSAICAGNTTTMPDATAGGAWSSTDGAVATIDATTGILSAISMGTTTISYTTNPYCNVAKTITVNPLPDAITGTFTVCESLVTTLAETTASGNWSSSNTTVAPVDASGVVSGNTAGVATVSYTLPTGCYAASTVTVNPLPAAITGSGSICSGNTAILAETTTGGSWSSSDPSVASIDATTGIATSGTTAGSVMITYSSDKGCIVTAAEQNLVAAISGSSGTCIGLTTTLSSATTGGTWSSSNTTLATVGTNGAVSALTAGNATITYAVAGCYRTQDMTINATPPAITGSGAVCPGNALTLSDASAGGTWDCINPAMVTVVPLSPGVAAIIGIAAGNATITYSLSSTCKITVPLTVNPLPATISGVMKACPGTTTTLATTTTGGSWISGNTSIASVDAVTGIVTGNGTGTVLISYMLPTSCFNTAIVTINPLPAAIAGTLITCVGATTALSDPTTGGLSWTSSNTAVATINASGGLVTAISAGTAIMTYTLGTGCINTATVTVMPAPAAITGSLKFCNGLTATLSTTTTGGAWSSSNTTVATIDASGVATGMGQGTATVSYTIGSGCVRTAVVTVTPMPGAITGNNGICEGAVGTLSDAGGGSWSSDNASVVTILAGNGVTTAIATGTANITYTVSSGCIATTVVTVNALPAAISGTATICPGTTTSLDNSVTGGTWSSSNLSIATVGMATGVVSAVATGNSTITYTLSTGCYKTVRVTVNPLPVAITGSGSVNTGATITLTDATAGGTWSSGNTSVATAGAANGVITGGTTGTAAITYTLPTGCTATTVVNVNAAPPSGITGSGNACLGATTTLSNSSAGGTWSSGNTSVATVGLNTGIVTGGSVGTCVISYTLGTGSYSTMVITVNTQPASITGSLSLCTGAINTLFDATTGGNSWTSSNTAVATVGVLSGVVNGITPGTATIIYTLNTGCSTSSVLTVNPTPAAITGTLKICTGSPTTLTDTDPLGSWNSGNMGVATIGSATGIVTALAAGTAKITYTLPTGCYNSAITTINASPSAIAGSPIACIGTTTSLSNTGGGTWMSDNTAVATVLSGNGVTTGVTAGVANITYTAPNSCIAAATVTVNPIPSASTGTAAVCVGGTTTLSNSLAGGTWISGNTGFATVGSTTGIVTALSSSGTVNITYTLPSAGCRTIKAVTINPNPGAITGTLAVCTGTATTLSSSTGGAWTSSTTAVATVGSISVVAGRVVGVAPGNTAISYTLPTGCLARATVTVNPAPNAGTITSSGGFAINTVTPPTSVTLSTTGDAGGTWSSSAPTKATITSGGVVNAVAAGATTITYSVTLGSCTAIATHTVTVTAARPGSNTTGTQTNTEISIYPNPNRGTLTINTTDAGTFTVYALDGKEIGTYPLTAGATAITLPSGIAAGIYICRYTGDNGNVATARIVYEQ